MANTPAKAASRWHDAPKAQRDWLEAYYRQASNEVISLFSTSQLIDAALAHQKLAAKAPPPQGKAEWLTGPGPREYRLLTVCPDRPFLVDTLQLTLRRHGAQVIATFHPQLRLDRSGKTLKVGDDGPLESLIQIHLQWAPADADAERALRDDITESLAELRHLVDDFEPMCKAARDTATACRAVIQEDLKEEAAEVAAFLDWLVESHFTFFAVQPTQRSPGASGFERDEGASLGLAAKGRRLAHTDDLMAQRSELDRYTDSRRLLVVTQSTVRARVHHDELLDVISVKRLDEQGEVIGTIRFIGLFTTDVYIERPRHIPLLRQRVSQVLARAGYAEGSHSSRALRDTLAMLPRSELWQSSEDELFALGTGVMALRDRHQLRLFLRRDRYGRFFSALLYLPRDRYGRVLRDRLIDALQAELGATDIDRRVEFPRGGRHALIYVRLTTLDAPPMPDDVKALETRLLALTQTWAERLIARLGETAESVQRAQQYAEALPPAYQERTDLDTAIADIATLEQLRDARPVIMRLPVNETAGDDAESCFTHLRLFSRGQPAALSEVLPKLENFGLFVTGQSPTAVAATARQPRAWIHEFDVRPVGRCAGAPAEQQQRMEAAFAALLADEIEDDPLNALVLAAGLTARETVIIRTVVRYLVQTGLPYSQAFIEQQLVRHPQVAGLLVRMFLTQFDGQRTSEAREADAEALNAEIDAALDAVPALDTDRILRAARSVVRATLRTNVALDKPVLSIKLDPTQISELPRPLPMFEIFVYSPQMEGVHLRGGRVARGGLRWSDRLQDFRTEVLGLVKAQQVKNSIIVPVGAKGGFVVKRGDRSDREAWGKAGRAAYVDFLCGLLDLTDNRKGDQIVPPKGVVCRDAPDPYLVVAADKGTARFSDLANETAATYDFWLGDAFASGGSQGYDHKKMGITARGAWESVKRHFREMDHDIQTTPFSVVGVGDMSGDVFGNGMLLSKQIRLIAAFDHRDIFIDPDPDPATSFAERQRLFSLSRSSWEDYDRSLISRGGGVYSRSRKKIELSAAAQQALGCDSARLTPYELMRAILKAPVDLFWNGGIGTYVKARHESHGDVGDRANDAVRVNGNELRVKVVGEGGNLGLTQAGRVEFALAGGRVFTDAIDNAGGVHSSDREVNIKIPLNQLMQAGRLTRKVRDPLLVAMTDDLAAAVVHDNLVQSAALSFAVAEQAERGDEYLNLIRALEQGGDLDRVVDGLPDEETWLSRRRGGQGLTAPELAVVLAHTKIALFDDLVASEVPDDPAFTDDLLAYFPPQLVTRYRKALTGHRLRREIIATILTNSVCNRMGAPFAHRLASEIGVSRAQVVHAWLVATRLVNVDDEWAWLDTPRVGQFALRQSYQRRVSGLLKHLTRSLLIRREGPPTALADEVKRHAVFARRLKQDDFAAQLPTRYAENHRAAVATLRDEGHDPDVAEGLAKTRYLGVLPDLVSIKDAVDAPPAQVAHRFFAVGDRFDLPGLHAALTGSQVDGRWPALARVELREDLFAAQRDLTLSVLAAPSVEAWEKRHAKALATADERLALLRGDEGDPFIRLGIAARALNRLAAQLAP
ncbi:MAG: NAD-glutamate dehydrogenase [Polycyclovorans sp.]|nr:NAD-glutamate dehydrogenase [Polycyclovorans sp.]|tara:strand:- start:38503 stop:43230 length:4728 start_codon:yes stop_codon:yes gene_type:complete